MGLNMESWTLFNKNQNFVAVVFAIQQMHSIRGGVKIENRENLGQCPIYGWPPPSDLWDIFEFQTFLKNSDPPPFLPNLDTFEFQIFLKNADPPLYDRFQTFLK